MWASSLAVALGLTLLAAASAQTTVSDYCDQQGQGRRLQFGGLGGLLGGGDDEPEEPCSERCPSGEGCADTVLGRASLTKRANQSWRREWLVRGHNSCP